MYAASEYGFGERDLVRDHPIVLNPVDEQPTYAGYRLLSRALVAMGVWVTPEGKSTTWAPGWNVERFEREAEILPLPSELLTVVLPIVRVVARTPAAPRAPQFRAGLSRPKQTPRPGLSKVGAVVVSNA